MKIEDVYKEKINDLIIKRDCTKFHITGIRHCDFKDKADDFIRDAAQKMLSVSFFPEKANPYDHEAVSCRHGRKQIGYVTTYDLEKYYILAVKDNADHLTGHFGRFSANIEDHLLKLYVPGSITLDDISQYRNKVNKQKNQLYGSWNHDAIDHFLVHSRHQDDAIACISQLKEHVLTLYEGHGTCTREELMPLLQDYKDCSHYDISLEGQQERWDILLYLDYLHDFNHQPGLYRDDFYEGILKDVEDVISQIGGELVRSVSYKSYIERLKELVTTDLPSSEAARHYLNTLPKNAFDDIRQQVESFPHHLYHLFHTNNDEFVRTLYYARIPRKYLDPFLSGIALIEAYARNQQKLTINLITNPDSEEDVLDYETPTFQLQRLLKQPWFTEVRTDERYDAAWTDAFVEALMGSDCGEQIAHDWAVQGKRERKAQVKGHVVGLLKDARVLKGSYGSIAKKVGIIVNEENKKDPYKTFADYMARGKKQPYAIWVKEYVEGDNKPRE